MKIKIKGELSASEFRQAIFELVQELEDQFTITHVKNINIYLTPSDGEGERVYCRNARGKEIETYKFDGPYKSVDKDYDMT